MKKLSAVIMMVLLLNLTGCVGMFSSFDQNDQSQQLVVKTSIQLATATYLDKNSSTESVNLVINTTDRVMVYISSDDIYGKTTVDLQQQLYKLISDLDMPVSQKIALTSLSEIILAEAVNWADMNIGDLITKEQANVLFFCANTMNETAKMYVQPESATRSYSVNANTEKI